MHSPAAEAHCTRGIPFPGLIDGTQLAIEAKTDEERKDQDYGVSEPNPSVITLNAVAAGQAVNDFLFDFLEAGERRCRISTPPFPAEYRSERGSAQGSGLPGVREKAIDPRRR